MTAIEDVEEYVYLGRLLNTKNDLEPEIHRRRRAAWAALNNIKNTSKRPSCLHNETKVRLGWPRGEKKR
ncbi:hypothetical protein CRE_29166 [Caenorhabditis remanei]|uniref:Uncharacterized protein n=1 Tax=Caenorhabditis remanei TaxID=31234 RepID=E3N9J6_CAERE|nr:hypothetical protein CRE_29166 [Caenorhabditis remanei]